jgi:predicted transcriptional regulator
MNPQATTLSRGELLKKRRSEHAAAVERTQALLREQKKMQQDLCGLVRDKPLTVPELAAASGLPTNKVLWFVAAMKKYGIVAEVGMCGDYPTYQKAEAK